MEKVRTGMDAPGYDFQRGLMNRTYHFVSWRRLEGVEEEGVGCRGED